jgi:asparagine synthase (glutamine-hydrolysing)
LCGIAGIVSRNTSVQPQAQRFDHAVDSMRSRGPDDRGSVYTGRVALGMRRLSIIDLKTGSQPIASEDGTISVVLNGELYSHQELRDQLTSAGHRFTTRSDAEALVHGYEQWGIEGLLERVDGMFAFALNDARNDTVFIARDRLGIKPLLYAERPECFCFASTITALIASGHVSPTPDPAGIRLYLHNQFTSAPHTVLDGVRKLPPASYLRIERGRPGEPCCYWRIPCEIETLAEDDWQERLRTTLAAAVRRHLVADVEVGLFLSGGLDSSIILSLLPGVGGARRKAFSIGVDGGPEYDETPLARKSADEFGAEFLPCRFAPVDFAAVARRVVECMEEPIADPACLPSYLLSAHARQFVKVVLSGEGADELFAGYGYYARFTTMFGRMAHNIRGRHAPAATAWAGGQVGKLSSRSSLSGYPHSLPASACEAFLRDLPSLVNTHELERNLNEKRSSGLPSNALNAALAADVGSWLPDNLLMKADRMSMAHGLEVRVPFLDHRVVELAFRMPPSLKRRRTSGKLILKQAFGATLGAEITGRPKHGFNLPLRPWFRDGLRPMITEWLDEPWDAVPWLDKRLVQRIAREHDKGAADYSRQIWLLFVLTNWFRTTTAAARNNA